MKNLCVKSYNEQLLLLLNQIIVRKFGQSFYYRKSLNMYSHKLYCGGDDRNTYLPYLTIYISIYGSQRGIHSPFEEVSISFYLNKNYKQIHSIHHRVSFENELEFSELIPKMFDNIISEFMNLKIKKSNISKKMSNRKITFNLKSIL